MKITLKLHLDKLLKLFDFLRKAIIDADGRTAYAWIFLAYENDATGHIASSEGGNMCDRTWSGVFEAHDYSEGNSDAPLVNVRLI